MLKILRHIELSEIATDLTNINKLFVQIHYITKRENKLVYSKL